MISLATGAAIRRAIRDPGLPPALRSILRLRLRQTDGGGAHYHVVEAGDALADAEAAVGFPLTIESEPTWDWAEAHPGCMEAVIVTSDDGPAQVLLAPDASPIADLLRAG